jgi:hypothetical protein
MLATGKAKLGTPIKAAADKLQAQVQVHVPPLSDVVDNVPQLKSAMESLAPLKAVAQTLSAPVQNPYGPYTPPPVIPSGWLAPHEQRWFMTSIVGLIEVSRVSLWAGLG